MGTGTGTAHSARRLALVGFAGIMFMLVRPAPAQPTFAGPKTSPFEFRGDVRNLPQPLISPKLPHALRNEFEGPPDTKRFQPARPSSFAALPPVAPMPGPIQNFPGSSFLDSVTGGQAGGGWPPDTNGDVGRNHYIQIGRAHV